MRPSAGCAGRRWAELREALEPVDERPLHRQRRARDLLEAPLTRKTRKKSVLVREQVDAARAARHGVLEDVGDEHGDLALVGDREHVEVDGGSRAAPLATTRSMPPSSPDPSSVGGTCSPAASAAMARGLGRPVRLPPRTPGLRRLLDLEEVSDGDLVIRDAERVGEPRQTGDDDLGHRRGGGLDNGRLGRFCGEFLGWLLSERGPFADVGKLLSGGLLGDLLGRGNRSSARSTGRSPRCTAGASASTGSTSTPSSRGERRRARRRRSGRRWRR